MTLYRSGTLYENGINPTSQSGALVTMLIQSVSAYATLPSGSHATLCTTDNFLPGFPVGLQKIVVRRSGFHKLVNVLEN